MPKVTTKEVKIVKVNNNEKRQNTQTYCYKPYRTLHNY